MLACQVTPLSAMWENAENVMQKYYYALSCDSFKCRKPYVCAKLGTSRFLYDELQSCDLPANLCNATWCPVPTPPTPPTQNISTLATAQNEACFDDWPVLYVVYLLVYAVIFFVLVLYVKNRETVFFFSFLRPKKVFFFSSIAS